MVLQLCETLEVPRAARNSILNAAGFALAYKRRDLNESDMAFVREAVDWTLQRHNPFPALDHSEGKSVRHVSAVRCWMGRRRQFPGGHDGREHDGQRTGQLG